MNWSRTICLAAWLSTITTLATAQSAYVVQTVTDGGTIRGTVKWSGPVPRLSPAALNKDPDVCDPDSRKTRDLERLVVSQSGGVANTVVFLKNITHGKALEFPDVRQSLNQKTCRYEPHVLIVPVNGTMHLKSSDHVLHTVHMSGAADYNLPFPFVDKEVTRSMNHEGLVDLRCNAGHTWMNAEVFVVSHPYYTVTDAEGNFEITGIPPGNYEIEAWHEGWRIVGQSTLYDVMTEVRVQRPVFADPMTWVKSVTVSPNATAEVKFVISEHHSEMAANH